MGNPLSGGTVSYQTGSPRLHQLPRFLTVFRIGVGKVCNNLSSSLMIVEGGGQQEVFVLVR